MSDTTASATATRPPSVAAPTAPEGAPARPPIAVTNPFAFVLLGATGDLAARKLLPALFALWKGGFLPERFAIVGAAIETMDDDAFRTLARKAIDAFARVKPASDDEWLRFAAKLRYRPLDFADPARFRALASDLEAIEAQTGSAGERLFYCAIAPSFFGRVIEQLAAAGLVRLEAGDRPLTRIVIEKPFGTDLDSARALNRQIHAVLSEQQTYRIDHYLGKESVQNLFAFRFGNAIFEPLLSNVFVEQVQITVAETVGMEGERGRYYDRSGALRDVLQNHVLQLLSYVSMDAPGGLRPANIRSEKLRILRNLVPIAGADVARRTVRGQYRAGTLDGAAVKAYTAEIGVAADSRTEAFIALRTGIDTWRWSGVPFLLRTGKRMARRATEVAVLFKRSALRAPANVVELDGCELAAQRTNVLVFRIQPDEGISISFLTKRPGFGFGVRPVKLDFDYERTFRTGMPEAYEHLLLDALKGYSLLFMSADEVEAQWAFATPILEAWADDPSAPCPYDAGSWGPTEAERLTEGLVNPWRRPGDADAPDCGP
ncbi:MAG TPA: glucose-6-phosphate dehydrogenase [Phycisphaerales bacterium]|nr:glucose-6-phosphate dehydrogenase [Phycisphaerales bacterium]HMP38428.1 glucose-6-phosphate dehydrogenase [Phycisphaerales bacterium]